MERSGLFRAVMRHVRSLEPRLWKRLGGLPGVLLSQVRAGKQTFLKLAVSNLLQNDEKCCIIQLYVRADFSGQNVERSSNNNDLFS